MPPAFDNAISDNNFSGRGWRTLGPYFGGFNAAEANANFGHQYGLGELQGRQQVAGIGAQQQGENYRAQLSADAAKYAANLQNSRFNQVFSTLKGALGGGFGGGAGFPGFGAAAPSPTISVGPVYTPGQIQQQVNSARAHNDASLGTQLKGQEADMANRGFAQGSPLQQALAGQAQMGNMIANTQAGTQIPWQAAQANANQLLSTQQAREGQYATRQKEVIERAQAQNQYRSSILAALSGIL